VNQEKRFICLRCLRSKFNHVPQPHKSGKRGRSRERCKGPFMRIFLNFDVDKYLEKEKSQSNMFAAKGGEKLKVTFSPPKFYWWLGYVAEFVGDRLEGAEE
jgi:hypothetical protein